MTDRLTPTQARRIALRSQGIGRRRAEDRPSLRTSRQALRRTVATTHLLQIDAVDVFARAHLMPTFTRSGVWDTRALERVSRRRDGHRLVEALAHEAAYTTPEVHDLLHFRRAAVEEKDWGVIREAGQAPQAMLEAVQTEITAHGPLSAAAVSRRLEDTDKPEEGWGWRRTPTQWLVEFLFRSGRLECIGRNAQFERLYDVVPGRAVYEPVPAPDPGTQQDAIDALVERAARAHGIATIASLADYFRIPVRTTRDAVARLRAREVLAPAVLATPDGDLDVLRHRGAPGSAPVRAACLVSPFDPVVFHRPRLESLFHVHYRIGIYTPATHRRTGYYALPFLLGDLFEARVDLRRDRRGGVLHAPGLYREPLPGLERRTRRASTEDLALALAGELRRAATWQGLDGVEVGTDAGDPRLEGAVREALDTAVT